MDPELLDAIRLLRLKLKAAKGMIRDLTVCAADVERLLHKAEPKEAELDEYHHHHEERHDGVAA